MNSDSESKESLLSKVTLRRSFHHTQFPSLRLSLRGFQGCLRPGSDLCCLCESGPADPPLQNHFARADHPLRKEERAQFREPSSPPLLRKSIRSRPRMFRQEGKGCSVAPSSSIPRSVREERGRKRSACFP